MSGGQSLETPVTVPLWAVLYAIRYGQTRISYASSEAVGLAEAQWDNFPEFIRAQLVEDWVQWQQLRPLTLGPPAEVGHRWDALRRRLEVAP